MRDLVGSTNKTDARSKSIYQHMVILVSLEGQTDNITLLLIQRIKFLFL